MDDVRSLTTDDLRHRVEAAIALRLDAISVQDHARAGADLLLALGELHRRGSARDLAHVPHGAGTPVLAGGTRTLELPRPRW